ncbi:hypothetical protein [Dokdonia sp.]|uniref:hypothetical protein n=1 Tax=Dokdonia sp. TaxID=2024995 RepID=UPI0032679088
MKTFISLLFILITFFSCSNDDKTIDIVTQEISRGAILRTLAINNLEFDINNINSIFSVDIEEQDIQNGNLLDYVDVFVSFEDHTLESGENYSTQSTLIERLEKEDFTNGSRGFPIRTLEYSFSQLLEETGVLQANVSCKDQFIITLELQLLNGEKFTENNVNAVTLASNTFSSSPFSYTITVLEPISEDLFIGNYAFNNVQEGAFGPSFIPFNPTVEITRGHSFNTRLVTLLYTINRDDPRVFEFTIACDEIIMGKYQLSSICGSCNEVTPGRRDCDTGDLILLGPDAMNAFISQNDDTVFELNFVEGYRGFDGNCGIDSFPSRIRFTKQ